MYLRLLNKTLNLDSLIDLQSKQRAYWCTILIAVVILAVGGQWQLFTNAIFAPHDAIYPISNAIFNGRFGLFNAGENLSKNFAGFYLHAPDRVFVSILLNIGFRAQIVQLAHIVLCYWILVTVS